MGIFLNWMVFPGQNSIGLVGSIINTNGRNVLFEWKIIDFGGWIWLGTMISYQNKLWKPSSWTIIDFGSDSLKTSKSVVCHQLRERQFAPKITKIHRIPQMPAESQIHKSFEVSNGFLGLEHWV